MPSDCPLLRELDAWFSLALDVLGGNPQARRDVLLLVGTAAAAADVAAVTRRDCEEYGEHLFVYPPSLGGRSFPLTPAFVEVTGLTRASLPEVRTAPEEDAAAIERAVATVDAALARITGVVRPGGSDRVRLLRMHAWKHELGGHVGVLARCYGAALPDLLARSGDCAVTCGNSDVSALVPAQRRPRVPAVA